MQCDHCDEGKDTHKCPECDAFVCDMCSSGEKDSVCFYCEDMEEEMDEDDKPASREKAVAAAKKLLDTQK